MEGRKPMLMTDEIYVIERSQDPIMLNGIYCGRAENVHVFFAKVRGRRELGYLLLDDDWIWERDGIITYVPNSPSGIPFITKEFFANMQIDGAARLSEILSKVGAGGIS